MKPVALMIDIDILGQATMWKYELLPVLEVC